MIATFVFSETSGNAAGTTASSQPVQNAGSFLPAGVAGPLDDLWGVDMVAELVGATNGTLDVYVQDSLDGVNWFDVVHFPQLLAAASAVKYDAAITFYSNATAPVVVGKNLSPALAVNTIVNGPFSDRVRLVMVAGAGTSAGAAVKVTVMAQRPYLRYGIG